MPGDIQDEIIALQAQEARLRFDRFAHDDALHVGARIMDLAREREQTIACSVWLGQQLVFHGALAGTTADNHGWMLRKVNVVRRYDASSQLVRLRWRSVGIDAPTPALGLDPLEFTFSGGAVPIRIGATQVGVAVASGVSDEVEHALVTEVLEEHLAGHRVGV
ncbi:heme-binding protein [Brachybacterium sp. MASK1Z-5]|uniref:Heme-binding protein n=1 Tax=Brachybacterium halotolerans TaxID=2795215 RepID=A0ABS1B711_9MICO|nr:heme-binding protein [Brachybacterium halotolerans]